MKKLSFLLSVSLLFLFSCSVDEIETNEQLNNDNSKIELQSKNDLKETVTLGFNLVFTGTYDYQGPDEGKCGPFLPYVNVINNGEGTGTHFGKLKSHFDFCVDVRDSSYPNGYVDAYFEDENGDRLFVTVSGFVLSGRVPGMPSFANSYFKDPFVITGGTGRFYGATGAGMTNDYNSSKDPNSHHHWQGKINLPKGK